MTLHHFVCALLLSFAALPAAQAEIDFNQLSVPAESAPAQPADLPALPRNEPVAEKAGEGAGPGGAVLNPFAQPSTAAPHDLHAERPAASHEPAFALTLLAILAGAGLLVWLLRRD